MQSTMMTMVNVARPSPRISSPPIAAGATDARYSTKSYVACASTMGHSSRQRR
jgi:hypothetical protein